MYRRRNLYIQPHATQIQNIARHANNNIQQQACIGCRVASLARMLLKLTCRLPPAAPKLSLPCSVSKNTFCQWLCFLALLVLLEPVSNLCAIHLFSFHFIYFLFIYSFHTRFLLTFSCFCLCSPSQSSLYACNLLRSLYSGRPPTKRLSIASSPLPQCLHCFFLSTFRQQR